jgi:hypothetical protein
MKYEKIIEPSNYLCHTNSTLNNNKSNSKDSVIEKPEEDIPRAFFYRRPTGE